jgi:hypothetical protein
VEARLSDRFNHGLGKGWILARNGLNILEKLVNDKVASCNLLLIFPRIIWRRGGQGSQNAKIVGGLGVSRVELEGSFQTLSGFLKTPTSEMRGRPVIPNLTRLGLPQTLLEAADGLFILALTKQLESTLMRLCHA